MPPLLGPELETQQFLMTVQQKIPECRLRLQYCMLQLGHHLGMKMAELRFRGSSSMIK
jgi:hypothetical protein